MKLKHILMTLTLSFVALIIGSSVIFAQADLREVLKASSVIESSVLKGKAGYLKTGAYLDENGNPVDMTWCSTGWVKVSGSDPARYFCRGTHWGSGSLALRGRSQKSGKKGEGGKGGYLESGLYLDENGNAVEQTYCSTGWDKVAGSNPARYTCRGIVSGTGPLNYPPD